MSGPDAMNPSIELSAPDLSRWREGNTGIEYVHTFGSDRPGPHVLLTAVVHGNELCGALTLDFLLREQVRPLRGTLSLAFANVAAFHSFDPANPSASRKVDEDFNRVWDEARLDGDAQTIELQRARELRPLLDRVDALLDIHSMTHPTAPLVLCGPTAKGQALARAIGYPLHVVADSGHAAGRRMRDYAAFADESSPKNALLIECGQHWEASSRTVSDQMALRFLAYFGMLDADWLARHLDAATLPPQQVIEVTDAVAVRTQGFAFTQPFQGMEVLDHQGTLLANDGDIELRTPYDRCVLIMPTREPKVGTTAVRLGRFVA